MRFQSILACLFTSITTRISNDFSSLSAQYDPDPYFVVFVEDKRAEGSVLTLLFPVYRVPRKPHDRKFSSSLYFGGNKIGTPPSKQTPNPLAFPAKESYRAAISTNSSSIVRCSNHRMSSSPCSDASSKSGNTPDSAQAVASSSTCQHRLHRVPPTLVLVAGADDTIAVRVLTATAVKLAVGVAVFTVGSP